MKVCRHVLVLGVVYALVQCAHGDEAEAEAKAEAKVAEDSGFKLPDVHFEFLETFQEKDIFENGWVLSQDTRYTGQVWKHEAHPGQAFMEDKALYTGEPHKHYGISKTLSEPFDFTGKDVVVQFETRWHNDLSCGGAYLKFLAHSEDFKGEELSESSPYVLMFGPDVCGDSVKKIHLIFRHQNPVTKEFEEKHCKKNVNVFEGKDKRTHLYTLVIKHADQSFQVFVDHKIAMQGKLTSEDDFKPTFNPPEEIDDPDDFKPEDWVDEAQIPDPEAVKPDDWDEEAPKRIPDPHATKPAGWRDDLPAQIPNPDEEKPDDWDEEEDGEWEAAPIANPECKSLPGCGQWIPPYIDNPDYKGKWTAPMIDNPDYQGIWAPKQIKNPHYFYQAKPSDNLPKIGAVAIEILANDVGVQFDNILIATDEAKVKEFAKATWEVKQPIEQERIAEGLKEKKKEERLKLLEDGGLLGFIQYGWEETLAVVMEYKVIAFSAIILVLGLMVQWCISGKKPANADHKKDDDSAKPEDDSKEEKEEKADTTEGDEDDGEDEDDKDGSKKEGQRVRRRTRRAE